eukprot:Opistho-1_new@24782
MIGLAPLVVSQGLAGTALHQRALDHGIQRAQGDGLGEQVHGACLHRIHGHIHTGVAGDHDQAYIRVAGADGANHLHPVHARQLKIDDDDIRVRARSQRDTLTASACHIHLVAFGLKVARNVLGQSRFVFNDENVGHGVSMVRSQGQCKFYQRTFATSTRMQVDGPAPLAQHAARQCKANPQPAAFGTEKGAKHLPGRRGLDPMTGVRNMQNAQARLVTDIQAKRAAIGHGLQGVGHQAEYHLPQHRGVGQYMHGIHRRRGPRHTAAFHFRGHFFQAAASHGMQGDWLLLQVLGLGHTHQFGDPAVSTVDGLSDVRAILRHICGRPTVRLQLQHLCRHAHCGQGVAQVVRHGASQIHSGHQALRLGQLPLLGAQHRVRTGHCPVQSHEQQPGRRGARRPQLQ